MAREGLAKYLLRQVPRTKRGEFKFTPEDLLKAVDGERAFRSRLDALRYAMANNRKVRIEYNRKSDGTVQDYVAAPYSFRFKGGQRLLYAAERKHGWNEIHSFLWGRARGVEVTKDEFNPKWPTEPESV